MITVQKSRMRRAARTWTAFYAGAVLCAGIALESQAQPAPKNDNLTNYQGIIGMNGSVLGTNIKATIELGELNPLTGVAITNTNTSTNWSTIWYAWTAPATMIMDFNTRNSTDPTGRPLSTVLAVYEINPFGPPILSYANLLQVASDQHDPNTAYPFTSRVDFSATLGTTYYIQVASTTNAADGYGQGYTVLNWSPSKFAGFIEFSTGIFPVSSLEDFIVYDDSTESIAPSLFNPAGSANARITVTRVGGYTGQCAVDLIVGDWAYTNYYETNWVITNIYATNFSNGTAISFTNIYLTNLSSINYYENYEDVGGQQELVYLPVDAATNSYETNANGVITSLGSNVSLTGLGLPDFFTNFTGICPLAGTYTGSATNSGVITVYVTNIICSNNLATLTGTPVPSSSGGVQYTPMTIPVIFNDFQMSQDVYVQIYPILGSNPQDTHTPGPEEYLNCEYGATNVDCPVPVGTNPYAFSGLNSVLLLTLTNAVLNPDDDQDIIPPIILETNAYVGILNYWGPPVYPTLLYSNSGYDYTNYLTFNFERETFRCNKNCVTAVIWVQGTLIPTGEMSSTYTALYTYDSLYPGETLVDDNGFATVADSDYAIVYYAEGQPAIDWAVAYLGDPQWNGIYGTLTFPPFDPNPESMLIPILENGAVEFDEDIDLQLFFASGGPPYPGYLGQINDARLTINFDNNAASAVQPGGALDRTYNVDGLPTSYPPGNPIPGANSTVNAVAIQAGGNAVIGGDFDAFNSTPINYIARLLTNGQMDFTFTNGLGRGPNSFVNAIVIDPASRIIIGGDFTSVNGSNAFHIARLTSSGALDTSFSSGFGFNGSVYALAIDSSGNILAGGDFTSYNYTNCNHIARILTTGKLDTSFLPSSGIGVTNGTDQDVRAVATDSSGNVILGGDFTRINGTNWNHIARLLTNGMLDTSFSPGLGADGSVFALAIQPNSAIILGGAFENFNLISRNSIARLTSSGTLDTTFDPGTGFDDDVNTLVLQPDGNILVGGQFSSYNTSRRIALARLFPSGWLDTSFMDTSYNQFAGLINPLFNNPRNQVNAMGLQSDSNVVIGGYFEQLGGGFTRIDVHPRQNVARVIGPATTGPENGGIGNCPGNIGLTQSPYTSDDTAGSLFVTLDRQNGSLGPVMMTLGTNTYPPSSSSATAADFGLDIPTGTYLTVWDFDGPDTELPDAWGWRVSDGEWGFNNAVQPDGDGDASLKLLINNDPTAAPIIYASLSELNVTETNLMTLGGVPIPTFPGVAQYASQLDIVNDNFPSGVIGFSATNYNVLESVSNVTITLLRTNGMYNNVQVYASTYDGTARAYTDYTPISNFPCKFGNDVTSNVFPITIIDHSTQQSNKFFYIVLSDPTGGATLDTNVPPLVPSNTMVTIIDDHFQPGYLSFSSPTYSVLKPGLATISVIRSGAALGVLSVEFGTSNGTALNNVNYVGVTNTLNWASQDIAPKTFTVQTLQDNTVEGPKTVNLFLFNAVSGLAGSTGPTNAQVLASPSNAVLTIVDTDSYGKINFLAPNFNILQNGGAATITVERTGGTEGTVTVNFATYTLASNPNWPTNLAPAVSNPPDANYSPTNGQLVFSPGVSSMSFTVPVINTSSYESNYADRLVGLRLFNGTPTNIAGQLPELATLTILDPNLHNTSAGSVDTTTQNGSGFNGFVNSLSLQPDGSILAGGDFTYFNGYPFSYAARLLPSGAFDTGFAFGLNSGASGTVWQVLSLSPETNVLDGNIMIVGDFDQIYQVNSSKIARLNLNAGLDISFNPGSGADNTVYTVAQIYLPVSTTNVTHLDYTVVDGVTNEDYYVIGGAFANYDGMPAGGVARLTQAGTMDPNFNLGAGVTGSNGVVHAVAITANNQILVAGDFTTFDNAPHHYLVELNVDGSLNTNFTAFDGVLTDINGPVRAMLVQPDGRIIIGGLFTTVNGGNYNFIARLNSDGSVDTNFNIGVGCNNSVEALALDSQLHILVGGNFTRASGVTRFGLTRLNPDGTVDPTINFGYGANGFVDAIVIQTNDEIDVAGGFTTFNNISENNFVRLYGGANYGVGQVQFPQQIYGVLASASNASITLQRLGGEGTPDNPQASVVFYTTNMTAVSGLNYTGVTNTVTFPLGETFETVTIPISNTPAVGSNLTVGLELTNGPSTNTAIGPDISAVLIITNVNSGVEYSAQTYSVTSDPPSGYEAIPVVRVGYTNTEVTVTVYTGTNGTAAPNINYIPETNELVFYPGVVTNYFLIPIINSPTTFGDTWVDLEMDDVTNAIIASPSSAMLTISSVLSGPGFLLFSQTNYTVSEGATNAVITILRTNGSANTVTVNLSSSNGTAIAGINYSNINDQITFFNGQTLATDNVPIIQLTNAGPNTTFYLTLSNPSNGAVITPPAQVPVTIINDIANFAFGSSTYFVPEAAGTATISVQFAASTNGTTNTVFYTTYSPTNAAETNGYAVPGVDYVPTNGTLTFLPGVTNQTIPVTILQGKSVYVIETFQVLLESNSPGTQLGVPSNTTVGIVGDVSGISFATNAYFVGENGSNILITVNRSNPNVHSNTVFFATSDNTASNNFDYVGTNGTLNFALGDETKTISVRIVNRNMVESNKSFNVTLSNPSTDSFVVAPSNTVVTITNVYVGVAFGGTSFAVSECASNAVIPVVLTGLTNSAITVVCQTANGGSAVSNVNYVGVSTDITFQPGQTVAYFYVTPINDNVIGPDLTVDLDLTTNQQPLPTNVAGLELLNPTTAILTLQECSGAYILASGTAFVSGTIDGASGVIYSNDTVKIMMGLRDVAGGNTTNLVATLLATNGITNVGPAQTYGVLIEHGATVAEPFTFTADGSNGQNITATLALQDGSRNLGTVAFGFTIGGGNISFTNTNAIFLPENTNLGPQGPTIASNSVPPGYGYPSMISVSGIAGVLTKVTATLSHFGHTYPENVDVVLQAPNGSNSILMSHCGTYLGVTNVTLTFDQTTNVSLPLDSKLTSGTFLPTTNALEMDLLPAVPTNETVPVTPPASPYPYAASLSTFLGATPNGIWSLWAMCEGEQDSGYISNGWILTVSTGVAVENDSDLEVTVATLPAVATEGTPLTYFVTVTNSGPSAATNVVITDLLPSQATYVSNSFSTTAPTSGVLTLSLPALAVGAGTSFDIVVIPTALGPITNAVTALALEPDPNTNNSVTNVNVVGLPSADVGVTLAGSPNPVFVGGIVVFTMEVFNNGPSIATAVMVTNELPEGFFVVSNGITVTNVTNGITLTNFTNVNGTITWTVGDMAPNTNETGPTMIVTAQALAPGTNTASVSAGSPVYDPLKGNNFAAVKIAVLQPMLTVSGVPPSYELTWPVAASNYWLVGATNLPPAGQWIPIPNPPVVNGLYTFPLPGANGYHFFQLKSLIP